MFFYTIQEYDGTNITFKIMNDDSKLVTLNLQRDYLDYEFNISYYKDKYYNIDILIPVSTLQDYTFDHVNKTFTHKRNNMVISQNNHIDILVDK